MARRVWKVGLGIVACVGLLIACSSSALAGREQDNALFAAVHGGNKAAVEKALKAGANPNARLMNGDTPMKIAERKGLTEIAQLLQSHGAGAIPQPVPAPEPPKPAVERSTPAEQAPAAGQSSAVEPPEPAPAAPSAPAAAQAEQAPAPAPTPALEPAVEPAAAPAPVEPAEPQPPVERPAAEATPPAPPVPAAPEPVAPPAAPAAASADIVQLLDSKALEREYNGIVVDFLVEEGKDRLPPDRRKQALDQLVTSLKEKAQVSKDEQLTISLGVLTGIGMGVAGNDIVSDAGSDVESSYASDWSSWIDAAFQLVHAGYKEEAADFFEFGMKHIPYPELKARCVRGLAAARPEKAYDFLMAATKNPAIEEVNMALRLLGHLGADPNLPKEKHDALVDTLIEFSQGIMHASSYQDAIYGLDVAGDPRAVEALSRFKKTLGIGSLDRRAALRSLLLTYKDTSVVDILKGMTKGGLVSLNNAWDQFYAGSLLIEAGEEAGFAYAEKQLAQVRKSFMAAKDDPDLRPDIVRVLARYGGARGATVLAAVVDKYRDDQWLKTWIAIGMLELGDKGRIDLVRASLAAPEWDYTAVRAVEALAKHGDLAGIPVLRDLSTKRPPVKSTGMKVLSALAGREDTTRDENRRLADLRIQVANALARINRPEGVPLLSLLLKDENVYVRSAAALALTELTGAEALDGLAEAAATDYGALDGRSRNPEVQAHVVRLAAIRFPKDTRTERIVRTAAGSNSPSVRFLALTLAP